MDSTMATKQPTLIDPDPYAAAAVWIAAASLFLQFAQMARDFVKDGKRRPGGGASVTQLGDAIQQLQLRLRRILRAVDRGSPDSEKEFWSVQFRIGKGQLRLEVEHHAEYGKALHEAYSKVGAVSLWINNLLSRHPDVAAEIGEQLSGRVGDPRDRLNELIEQGAPIRDVILEANRIIDACENIINERTGN